MTWRSFLTAALLAVLPATSAMAAKPGTKAAPAKAAPKATVEEAKAFYAQVDADLRKLWVARDRAGWVNQNFLTDDTDALAAAAEEATASYLAHKIPESRRFDGLDLPPELARQHSLLRFAQTVPAPLDPKLGSELALVSAGLQSSYGKGQYCPPGKPGSCMKLDDLEKVLAESRKPDELVEAWKGWHDSTRAMRGPYTRYVELANQGARELGFTDLGALWKGAYDMTPEQFEAEEERLWQQVKPLYDELHCYVRKQLRKQYGEKWVPKHGAIPVPFLGNMWAQEWTNIFPLVDPSPGSAELDASKAIVAKKVAPKEMVKLGEKFFTSLGFDPLPESFWQRSLFVRPADRDVVCHASAWDVSWSTDLRIKMCIKPTEEDLVTIHHELGHIFYFQRYAPLPVLFQQGANDGFHEAIGDTIAFSVNPPYLKQAGLLTDAPDDEKARVRQLMRMALSKISFLPFGLLVDKWRWDVFAGKVKPEQYTTAWWALRKRYQGVAPPVERTEAEFDPGAKFHVASSTPYARYFLSHVYQFQFHEALCRAAGQTGPLDRCSIYGNAEAGKRLKEMLALGASKPWPDAMQILTGKKEADAGPLLAYFAPLRAFLAKETAGEQCGWE